MKVLPPVMVSFSVTRRCNLRCKHCYSESVEEPHPNELSTEEAKRVISEIAEAGARLIIFDGGEPLMRPDIYELISHARDVGLRPLMGTNATLITPEVARKLKEAGLRALAISLDGADPKAHDEFRGVEGAWEQTMIGIENVKKASIPFQIAPTLRRGRVDEWLKVAEKAKELGAMAVEVFDYVSTGRGGENPDLALTTEERRRFAEQYIARQRADDMVYRCIAIPHLWVEIERTVPEEEVMMKFVRTCCGAGIRYACVLYDGTVYPCMVLQVKAGDVREQSFVDIWYNSPVFATLRDRDKLEGKCGSCEWRYICGGARCKAYIATGNMMAEDPTCWLEGDALKRSP